MTIIEKKITNCNCYQYNQLIKLESENSGFTNKKNEYVNSFFAVQVTTEKNGNGDFVGIYNLDGDVLNLPNPGSWELAENSEVFAEILDAFNSWEGF